MAECRNLELTLVSANDLPDVRSLGLMKVFATISLKANKSKSTKKITTPPDTQNETNPRWNFRVEYTISESSVRKPGVNILVKLYCKRTFGDRYIGEVSIPMKGLFDRGLKSEHIITYDVSGTSSGKLNVLYSFSEMFLVQKSSSWKTALELGFFLLVGGAVVLLTGEDLDGDEDGSDCSKNKNNHYEDDSVEEVIDGEIFYNAID